MDIFYLTVGRYHQYNPKLPPGKGNPGGGISDKTVAVLKAWRRFYQVGVSERIADYPNASILVVEPLWFKLRGGLHNHLQAPDMEEAVREYEEYDAEFKILYLSEFSFLKIPPVYRKRILAAATVVTSNCAFQRQFFAQLGIETKQLCDPVDVPVNIQSTLEKTMAVCALGRISTVKNSGKVIEIFQALKDLPVETVYIGDAALWGESAEEDKILEVEMRCVADKYYKNQPFASLLKLLGGYSCAIFDSFHDSCSASNLAALMMDVRCFYGLHSCWRERPGVHQLDSVENFVDALKRETADFSKIPKGDAAWAVERYSLDAFLRDWSTLLAEIGYAT